MISLFLLAAGGAAVGVAQTMISALQEGNSEKPERRCDNCRFFNDEAWNKTHEDKNRNMLDADKYRYKIYCCETDKEYSLKSREDIHTKMLCGNKYDYHRLK